jgi:hypothetical protein
MSHPPVVPLPPFERRLLNAAERLVPRSEREDWRRSWTAELWCGRNRRGLSQPISGRGDRLLAGLLRDACWLRAESWRRLLRGTALLCIASILALCVLSAALNIFLHGGLPEFLTAIVRQSARFLVAAPLVIFVASALAPAGPAGGDSREPTAHWVRRQAFLNAKVVLLLLLAFFLSGDLCQPIFQTFPLTSECLQVLCFVFFGLLALRWAFEDQSLRCNHCLSLLSEPSRVGLPTRNWLEWNGVKLACRHGHGSLSISELETSWSRSSTWTAHNSDLGPWICS